MQHNATFHKGLHCKMRLSNFQEQKCIKSGLKLRVRNENLIFLFLNQNIYPTKKDLHHYDFPI